MRFRVSSVSVILSWCAVVGAIAACSASSGTKGGVSGNNGGTSAGTSGGSAGTGVVIGGNAGTGVVIGGSGGTGGTAVGSWIPTDLPAPWQYYNEGTDRAFKDPALGADVRNQFGGTPTTDADLAIVYPLNEAMHPVNTSALTFQWHRGAATNTVFRIDAVGDDSRTSRFYVTCTPVLATHECLYQMPESDWLWLAAEYAGSEVTMSINATDGLGGAVGTSAAIKTYFSPEPVYGSLYYWAAGQKSLKRANFGAKHAVPFITPNSDTDQFACVACHSVSRNGKAIAFAVSNVAGETVAAIQTAPTEDPTMPYVEPAMGTTPFTAEQANAVPPELGSIEDQPLDHFGHNPALSPDGAIAAINGTPVAGWPPFLELRDTVSGDTIVKYELGQAPFPALALPIMPEWSPDGQSIVASLAMNSATGCMWTYVTCDAAIVSIPVVGGNSLGTPVVLATSADPAYFNFYPTWSPDGQWVAFMSAKRESDGNGGYLSSIHQNNGVIRLVRATGGPYTCPGSGCYELTRGTQYTPDDAFVSKTGKHSTWPKFTPFAQGTSGNIMFISFTTKINYGWQARSNVSQIWMFAVDTTKAGTSDASYAPVWLTQQDVFDGGLTPYWTETLPCQSDPSGGCTGCVAGEECHVSVDNVCECRAIPVK